MDQEPFDLENALTDDELDAIAGGYIVKLESDGYNKYAIVNSKGRACWHGPYLGRTMQTADRFGLNKTVITMDEYRQIFGKELYDK